MAASLQSGQDRWLDEHTRRWVSAGIISHDQADAIVRCERGEAQRREPEQRARGFVGARLPLVAEALSYLGIVLVTASGAFVVVRFWGDLRVGGRLGVGMLVTVLGFAAAAAVWRIGDPGSVRLASFLRLCGTGGVALVAGVTAVALGAHDPAVTALAVGTSVLAVSLGLWRNRDRVLPFLSSVVGAATAVAGLYDVLAFDWTPAEAGVAVWAVSLALGMLGARGIVRPVLAVMLVAELGALEGALVVADRQQGLGLTLGLVTAVAGLGAGLVLRHSSLVALGVIGFLVFLARTLSLYIRGTASAVAVLAVGVALVLVALRAMRHRPTDHPPGEERRPEC